MSSHCEVVPKRTVATAVAIAFALCLLGSQAAAQVTIQPKVEVYGGYSWLHPNGFYGQFDNGIKTADIVDGFDISGVYYLPNLHNLGLLIDGSGHFNKSHVPGGVNVGIGDLGLQYKWHTDQLSPFARIAVGADRLVPPAGLGPAQWRPAIIAGGGLDLTVTHRFSIRVVQADYIWTYFNPAGIRPYSNSAAWNMIRLSAGLLVNFGNYAGVPPTATCTANPPSVKQGEPLTVSATGAGFNPKHTLTYGWTTTGGKLATPNAQSSTIDTTGATPG